MNILRLSFISLILLNKLCFATDDISYRLQQENAPMQVRWDNAASSPYMVAGSVKDLQEGKEITLQLDANSYLRIYSPDQDLIPNMFNVKISDGTGLYVNARFKSMASFNKSDEKEFCATHHCPPDNKDKKELILPIGNRPAMLRLSMVQADKLKLSLFTARYENPADFVFYPDRVNGKGPGTRRILEFNQQLENSVNFQRSYVLGSCEGAKFTIEGPTYLELTSRYIYDQNLEDLHFPYMVSVMLDDKALSEVNFLSGPDYQALYLDNRLLSNPDSWQLFIPKGKHKLVINSINPVLLKVHEIEQPGYLFSSNSKPVAIDAAANIKKGNNTLLPSDIVKKIAVVTDNEERSAGLSLSNMARNLTKKRKDEHSMQEYGRQIDDIFTFYRDLLPSNQKMATDLTFDWVINYQLADITRQNLPYNAELDQVSALLKQLILGQFVKINQKLQFMLPKLSADSELRVVVQQSYLAEPIELYVKYDANPPQLLTIYPKEQNKNQFRAAGGLIALDILERHIKNDEKLGTLSGIFAHDNSPGYLKSAGIITLPLPVNTHKIIIWPKHRQQNLWLAVQYKDSKKFDPDSRNALANISAGKIDPVKIFVSGLRFFDYAHKNNQDASQENFLSYLAKQTVVTKVGTRAETQDTAIAGLYNDWLDLIRFLHERYLKFGQGLDEVDPNFVASVSKKPTIIKKDMDYVRNLSKNKQWNVAVNKWSNIIENGNQEQWASAHLARADALKEEGESYLAERSLKALILNAKDASLRSQAYHKLINIYQERKYYYGLEGLVATYLIRLNDNSAELEKLVSILLQDNNQKQAMELQALLANTKTASDDVQFLAMRKNQSKIKEEDYKNVEDKRFWQAQCLAKNGLYKKALEAFGKAGERGKAWKEHLKSGLAIKDKLRSSKEETREEGFKEWLTWYHNHPGPKSYEDAKHLVTKFYQSAILYSTSRDTYEDTFVTGPAIPISLKVIGPARLQIVSRPLIDSNKNLLLIDSWVIVTVDGKPYHNKINNYISPNPFHIIDNPSLNIGIEQEFAMDLGYGEHNITVAAQGQKVIVHPLIEKPILALPVLPTPTLKTAEFVKNEFWKGPEKNKGKNNSRDNYRVQYGLVNSHTRNVVYNIANSEALRMDYQPTGFNSGEVEFKSGKEDIATHLNQILYEYKRTKSKVLLVKGIKLCEENQGVYNVDQLCNSFDLLSRWRPIMTLDDNTEVIVKESRSKWDPENVNLSLRKDLMTEDDDDSFVLSDTSISVVDFTNENSTSIKLSAGMVKLIGKNPGKAVVGYQIDDGEVKTMTLNNSGKQVTHEFSIDKGKHSLRIHLVNPTQESFVKFSLNEQKSKNDKWLGIDIKRKKKYFVAAPGKLVKLTVEGPTVLAVHKYLDEDNAAVKNYYFLSGKNTITLPGDKDQAALYKIYEKIPANPKVSNLQAVADIDYEVVPESGLHINLDPEQRYFLVDDIPLAGQDSGTWSLSAGAFSRLSEDTTNVSRREKFIKYLEQLISYRYFSEMNRLYFYQDLFIRELRHGKLSQGLTTKFDYVPVTLPFNIFGEFKFNTQRFNSRQNYALYEELGIRSKIFTSRKLFHAPEISIFNRNLSGKRENFNEYLENNLSSVDPDVYSNYSRRYKRGVNLTYKAGYMPYLDNLLWASAHWQSDRKFTKSNFIEYGLGVDQLINQFVGGLDFTTRHYFKNDRRNLSFNRNHVGASMSFEKWLSARNHRLECNASVARVFDTNTDKKIKKANGYDFSLKITMHLGNARNYRDFKHDEIKFRSLKARKIPIRNWVGE